jgi:hypothetical protein
MRGHQVTGRRDLNLEDMSDDERQAYLAYVSARPKIPTRGDSATLLESGCISLVTITKFADGQEVLSNREIKPGEPDYDQVRSQFKLDQPGDQGSRTYLWVDEAWVLETPQ